MGQGRTPESTPLVGGRSTKKNVNIRIIFGPDFAGFIRIIRTT